MSAEVNGVFERLRQAEGSAPLPSRKPGELLFQIGFGDAGAHVRTVDAKGKEITPDERHYHGATRRILKAIGRVRERNLFNIRWDDGGDRVHLSDLPDLVEQLGEGHRLVDREMAPVTYVREPARLYLRLSEERGGLVRGRFALEADGRFLEEVTAVDENHVYAEGALRRVWPLGPRFGEMGAFEGAVAADKLEMYLSLLFSGHPGVRVDYRGYRHREEDPAMARTAILFEEVEPSGTLHLRIGQVVAGFKPGFIEDYGIERIARVIPEASAITVRELVHADLLPCIRSVRRLLKKHGEATGHETFHHEGEHFIIPGPLARAMIRGELGALIEKHAILGAEKLGAYKVRTKRPNLRLTLSSGIDFLEGEARLQFGDRSLSLQEALSQYDRDNYITLGEESIAVLDAPYVKRLRRLIRSGKEGVTVSFFDLPEVEELIGERAAEADRTFSRCREVFRGFGTISGTRPRLPKLSVPLRDYQKQGFKWLKYLQKHRLGGCLADDMGLGKTLQAIAILAAAHPKAGRSSLVVMPRSLLFNWEAELARFAPALTYYRWHGTSREMAAAEGHHVILTTYAMVRNDIEIFRERRFHYIILDESQHVKNINTKASKAVALLEGEYRLALSGTPMENNLGEIYALFRFLNPAMFGTPAEFNRRYLEPVTKGDDRDALASLRRKIYPFILRRLKGDVVKDLPERSEQILYVEMSADHAAHYEERRQFLHALVTTGIREKGIARSQFAILQALSELRQLASVPEMRTGGAIESPKREPLMERLEALAGSGHKVLLFANYLHALESMGEALEGAGIEHLTLTGATRGRERLVTRFQAEERLKVFLMTLKAGGVGLNLTAADYVFIHDPWWNGAAESQAIDRSHRIGQRNKVFSYKLITRGTIEEKILRLQERKRELFDRLIASDGAAIKSMDESDVDFVLGR